MYKGGKGPLQSQQGSQLHLQNDVGRLAKDQLQPFDGDSATLEQDYERIQHNEGVKISNTFIPQYPGGFPGAVPPSPLSAQGNAASLRASSGTPASR